MRFQSVCSEKSVSPAAYTPADPTRQKIIRVQLTWQNDGGIPGVEEISFPNGPYVAEVVSEFPIQGPNAKE